MKKKLESAIKAHDIAEVRSIITAAIARHPGSLSTLELVREAVAQTADLFVADDGEKFPKAADFTRADLKALEDALPKNFSERKFQLFTEVMTSETPLKETSSTASTQSQAAAPKSGADKAKSQEVEDNMVSGKTFEQRAESPVETPISPEAAEIIEVSQNPYTGDIEITEVEVTAVPEEVTTQTSAEEPENLPAVVEREKSSPAKIFGYVLMVLGLACAIVGLCVPVHFMVGLGIGVFMLSSALVYFSIKN